MASKKRKIAPGSEGNAKKKRDDVEFVLDDGNDCVIVGELIPREDTPVIDFDTVGDVDINSAENSVDEEISEISVSSSSLSNFGARPDFDRKLLAQRIQKFKKDHREAYETMKLDIMHHYDVNIQKDNTILWKTEAKQLLEAAIRKNYPGAELYIVGSTCNGCGSYNSDMDVCAVIPEIDWDDKKGPDNRVVTNALYRISREITRNIKFIKKSIVIRAVVPILQVEFQGKFDGLDVDLNINNYAGIRNTHLIQQYSHIDERFPILCLLIKHWAIVCDINSAQGGSFNSYSLILLVLHYLQCACQPPIMPNLHELYPDKFNNGIPVEQLDWNTRHPVSQLENLEELPAILLGFFEYYAGFDFDAFGISIRHARVIPKSEPLQKFCIFIEEPYDHRNTARCVHGQGFGRIKLAFADAIKKLHNSKKPDLKNLGIDIRRTSA